MEKDNKPKSKTIIIAAMVGMTIAMLWQFGGPLLTEGPLGDLIKKIHAAAPANTMWEYKEAKDKATGVTIKGATLNSTNTADTGFGPTARMQLILTENKHQKIVAVRCLQGVSVCASDPGNCSVDMEFDNGPVEKIKGYYSKQNILMDDSDRLFNRIKTAKQLTVGAVYVTGAGKVHPKFNFAIAGLSWKD